MLIIQFTRMLLVCIVTLIYPLSSFALDDSNSKTQIFFVNGVWNDNIDDALYSAGELQGALAGVGLTSDQYGLSGTNRRVRTIWNPGDGYVSDVLEVFAKQRVAGVSVVSSLFDAAKRFLVLLDGGVPDADSLARMDASISLVKNKIYLELEAGRPVVIVAHSQGNIVVNNAVSQILKENPALDRYIGVVGVGVALNKPVGSLYRYVTVDRDIVINNLPNALPSNFVLTEYGNDGTGHAFQETYLSSLFKGFSSTDPDANIHPLRTHVASLVKDVFNQIKLNRLPLPVWKKMNLPYSRTVTYVPDNPNVICTNFESVSVEGLAEGKHSCTGSGYPPFLHTDVYNLATNIYRLYMYPNNTFFKLFPDSDWFLPTNNGGYPLLSSKQTGSLSIDYIRRRADFLVFFNLARVRCGSSQIDTGNLLHGLMLVKDDGIWLRPTLGSDIRLGNLPVATADNPLTEEYYYPSVLGGASLSDHIPDKLDWVSIHVGSSISGHFINWFSGQPERRVMSCYLSVR